MSDGHLTWPRRWSLQASLIAMATLVTLLAWAAGGAVVWGLAARHAAALHDHMLRSTGQLILGLSGHELVELNGAALEARIANSKVDTAETLGDNYRYQLWDSDGHLLLSNFGLPSAAAMARWGKPGFSWLWMDGERWRVFSIVDGSLKQELHIAERASEREWLSDELDWRLVPLVLTSLLAVLLPALLILRRVLRPLRHMRDEVAARSPSNLAHLHIQGAPSEVTPIVAAMNALLHRVDDAMRREASFTSIAAHELRTPLASLRVLAQTALGATDSGTRDRALQDLMSSADRCSHLQDQLLTLARLDAAKVGELGEELDLTEALTDAASELAPKARARRIKIATHTDGSMMRGHAFGVRTLLRNLLSNAIRYAPEGGRVEVSIKGVGDSIVVGVDDSGTGIPPADRERVFERFERLSREQNSGVGLGLSIVRSVVEAHGSTIQLGDSHLGGLRVVVRFEGRRLNPVDAEPVAPVAAADDVAG